MLTVGALGQERGGVEPRTKTGSGRNQSEAPTSMWIDHLIIWLLIVIPF